jgi:hypothetical protein
VLAQKYINYIKGIKWTLCDNIKVFSPSYVT